MAEKPKTGKRQKRPPDPNNPVGTLTIEAAAARLGIGRNQAYEAAHAGQIPVIKIGQRKSRDGSSGPARLLVPIAALDRLLGQR